MEYSGCSWLGGAGQEQVGSRAEALNSAQYSRYEMDLAPNLHLNGILSPGGIRSSRKQNARPGGQTGSGISQLERTGRHVLCGGREAAVLRHGDVWTEVEAAAPGVVSFLDAFHEDVGRASFETLPSGFDDTALVELLVRGERNAAVQGGACSHAAGDQLLQLLLMIVVSPDHPNHLHIGFGNGSLHSVQEPLFVGGRMVDETDLVGDTVAHEGNFGIEMMAVALPAVEGRPFEVADQAFILVD